MVFDALRQSFMDHQVSSTSPCPWFLVIEALALSNQIDVSLLLDLVGKSLEKSVDLGSNVREMISLRILERVFAQGASANTSSPTSSTRIEFNPSERCEDVLQHILHEISESNWKASGPEMLKWNLEPFIRKKRASLPQSTLQQLKDAILTGSHPLVASLKKQSGLLVEDQPEHEVLVNDGNGGTTLTLEDSTTEYISSKGIISHDLLQEEQVPHIDNMVPNDKFDKEPKHNGIEEAEGDQEDLFGGLETANEDMNTVEQNIQIALPNTDESENAFLSSQCAYSEDSAATADLREQNLCKRCKKGGKLLTCSSNGCKLVVHEDCLGSSASFDSRGSFYCTSCAYFQAIIKHQEAMKKFSSARKDYSTFCFSGTRRQSKKPLLRSNQMEQDEYNGKTNEVIHREFEQQGKHGTPSPDAKNDMEEKRMGQDWQSPRVQEQRHRVSLMTQGNHLSCQLTQRSDMIERHAETISEKGVLCPPGTELSNQNTRTAISKSTDAEEKMSGGESESSDASKYRIRYRKQGGRAKFLTPPKKD